jgi:signal transduction histidine kinase
MPGDPKDIRSLRRRAEKLLSEAPEKLALIPGMDVQKLVMSSPSIRSSLRCRTRSFARPGSNWKSHGLNAELYDLAPLGYLTFDKMRLITRANFTACGLLAIERSLFVKKPFALFVHPESQDTFYFHIRKVLETTARQTCQLVLKRKGGPLTQRLEAQLRRSHKMEALGTMAAGMAHDFNNILAAILGFTELG